MPKKEIRPIVTPTIIAVLNAIIIKQVKMKDCFITRELKINESCLIKI